MNTHSNRSAQPIGPSARVSVRSWVAVLMTVLFASGPARATEPELFEYPVPGTSPVVTVTCVAMQNDMDCDHEITVQDVLLYAQRCQKAAIDTNRNPFIVPNDPDALAINKAIAVVNAFLKIMFRPQDFAGIGLLDDCTSYSVASNDVTCLGAGTFAIALVQSATGLFTGPTDAPTGVATFSGLVYDSANRPIRRVEFGTNMAPSTDTPPHRLGDSFANGPDPRDGDPALWPPSTPPDFDTSGFGNHLVSATHYGIRGLVDETTDPLGRRSRLLYDDLGRVIASVENAGATDVTIEWDETAMRWDVTAGLDDGPTATGRSSTTG